MGFIIEPDELKEIADVDKESVTTQLRLKTAVTTDTGMRIINDDKIENNLQTYVSETFTNLAFFAFRLGADKIVAWNTKLTSCLVTKLNRKSEMDRHEGGGNMAFDYELDFAQINFRDQPELYRVGRGEQGVLLVEPYKSEILPHWRFKTPEIAKVSSDKIYQLFLDYQAAGDFVGMDMSRKFLQMGYTRSRRYANYKGGRKYDENGDIKERIIDEEKAKSATIFEEKWKIVRENEAYLKLKKEHQKKYG